MQEYSITATANGPTDWVRLDTKGQTIHLYHIAVIIPQESGATADVEFTIETDLSNATPICHHILNGVSTTAASVVHAPMAGIRLNIADYVSGKDITLKVLQS